MHTLVKIFCPICGSTLYIRRKLVIQDRVICFFCDKLLKVVRVDPLEFDWSYPQKPSQVDDKTTPVEETYREITRTNIYNLKNE
jgi:hypothetical protein